MSYISAPTPKHNYQVGDLLKSIRTDSFITYDKIYKVAKLGIDCVMVQNDKGQDTWIFYYHFVPYDRGAKIAGL